MSYKRSRTQSQMGHDNISAIEFAYAPSAGSVVSSKKKVGEVGVVKASSLIKQTKNVFTYRDLLNSLFPKVNFTSRTYGNQLYGFNSSDDSNGVTKITLALQGDAPMLTAPSSRQGWYESIGLPLWHMKAYDNLNYNCTIPTVASVADLRKVAQSASPNIGYVSALNTYGGVDIRAQLDKPVPAEGNNIGVALTGTHRNDTSFTGGLKASFWYDGGYQKHIFKNCSNSSCHIELFELHPRDFSVDWRPTETQSTKLIYKSVAELLAQDYEMNYNRPLPNNIWELGDLNIGVATMTALNDCTDPAFSIRKDSRLVHKSFKVSKPVRVVLAPGEVFEYTMKFPAFMFNEASLAQEMSTTGWSWDGTSKLYPIQTFGRPTSVPKFTKRLVVRFHGESGVQLSDGPSTKDDVTSSPAELSHIMIEHHNVRCMPETNNDLFVYRDYTGGDTGRTVKLINEETNEIVNYVDI